VPQGRSLGIYLILANQLVEGKATRLMPNIGWKIALRVASKDQMSFIDSSLKRPKYAGRGYIQAMGEDPVEFQSGYSGNYVKYSDMRIEQSNISIKELLPNGHMLTIKEEEQATNEEVKDNAFLEMNQLIKAIQVTQKRLKIPNSKKIYLPPMPRRFDFSYSALKFKNKSYRSFSKNKWSKANKKENYLQAPVGLMDLTKQCTQQPLVIEFKDKTPHLLLIGSQSDLNEGLRSVLFSLLSTHSPDDLHIYMLEFGQGLQDMPPYPHIGDIILEKETEKIARAIELFESEFLKREEASRDENTPSAALPDWFLIINNFAGLYKKPDLYLRIIQLITKNSHKYGIHILAMALRRTTNTKSPLSDLKLFSSRIVFPSVDHENYWMYLGLSERKLAKLTSMDIQLDEEKDIPISRAYWLNENDPDLDKTPLEIQLASPKYGKVFNEEIFSPSNQKEKFNLPLAIDVLKDKYHLASKLSQNELHIGIKWLDLEELLIPFDEFPSIWGVSGPRKSGKTEFLTSFVHQLSLSKQKYEIDVFSGARTQLTDYCESRKYKATFEPERIAERLDKIIEEDFDKRKKIRLIVFDDINFLWERTSEFNDKTIEALTKLANKMYRKKDTFFVASFNYSTRMRTPLSQDALMREFVNNKTGLSLGYDGEWLVNSTALSKYTKKFDGVIPPGRGVFVLNGDEIEVQTYLYEEEE